MVRKILENIDDILEVVKSNNINLQKHINGIYKENAHYKYYSKWKGKNVLTGKEYSEWSYRYQKYYLKEIECIDIDKNLKLQKR